MVQPTSQRDPEDASSIPLERLYVETCAMIRATDEISFKLLGLVPLVSGVGILVLLGDKDLAWSPATVFISAIAAVVTFALYRWEMRNVDYCSLLIRRAVELEREVVQGGGAFAARPKSPIWHWPLVDRRGRPWGKRESTRLLYRTVLSAWLLLPAVAATVHYL
jgi:hypothetical protein